VAPMLEGATAHWPASGCAAPTLAGKSVRAESHDQSAEHRQKCAQEKLAADIPAPHVRRRDPRVATQARRTPPPAEQWTLNDVLYDHAQDGDSCPQSKGLPREARRHKIGTQLSRRAEADAADGGGGPLGEPCRQNVATRRNPLAVFVEQAAETWSQPLLATIDTPEARQMAG
jgi:hypothetical protein